MGRVPKNVNKNRRQHFKIFKFKLDNHIQKNVQLNKKDIFEKKNY